MNSNYLCIIDGEYKIYKTREDIGTVGGSNGDKMVELVEFYRQNLAQIGCDEAFNLVHSRDGREMFAFMLKAFGVISGESDEVADKALEEFSSVMNASGLYDRISHYTVNSSLVESPSYIAFVVADFDPDNDRAFARLEEAQFKLTNLASVAASSGAALATLSTTSFNFAQTLTTPAHPQKRFIIVGWPVIYHCIKNELSLVSALEVERPLYCKLMSGCVLCFTGFRKENKPVVSNCIRLAHYMGASVRKEYNKKITHLIVKSTLSTKYKTAHNIGKCHLLTEEWIFESWKHRNEADFDVSGEEFLKKFQVKALYSLSIAFVGFSPEEAAHMREVTIENGGTPATGIDDPECTHIVVDDQGVKRMPCLNGEDLSSSHQGANVVTPTSSRTGSNQRGDASIYVDLKSPPFASLASATAGSRASVVRAEWFWASIQMCCRASEVLYEFNSASAAGDQQINPPTKRMKLSRENLLADATDNSPRLVTRHIDSPDVSQVGLNHHNKKKSANNLIATNLDYDSPMASGPNNSSSNVAKNANRLSTDRLLNGTSNRNNISNNNLSTSASLLDATTDDAMSIDSPFESKRDNSHGLLSSASSNGANGGNASKKVNKRFQRIYELFETEKRFVTILHTIIHVFKEPIEAPDQAAGPILDATEIKEIFGNLPPIYETHCNIKDRLERLTNRIMLNEESISVGEIYLDNADALLKIYPPFLNFYEKTKEAINACDRTKPRFHAFLKIAQSRPECGRQTLIELLIRPVQRLPSTLLLLDDILKETPKTHRDHELLSKAICSLKEVMTHINEDKRKTDNHMTMFNLVNDIDNCPPNLLSSHRSFLKKLYVLEMANELFKKGGPLALFLFSDCLEICKPKFKLNSARSPSSSSSSQTMKQRGSPTKYYKHIALFSLNNVTKVCDILQNNDDTDLFGIVCRLPGEKDKFFHFKVMGSSSSSSSSSSSGSGGLGGFGSHISTMTLNQLPSSGLSSAPPNGSASNQNNSNYISSSRSYTYSLSHTSTMTLNNVSMAAPNASSLYTSTTNLNFYDDQACQAQLEKKEFMKLLAQGICNVKCITEYAPSFSLPATPSTPRTPTFRPFLPSPVYESTPLPALNDSVLSDDSLGDHPPCVFDQLNDNIRQIEAQMDRELDEINWWLLKPVLEQPYHSYLDSGVESFSSARSPFKQHRIRTRKFKMYVNKRRLRRDISTKKLIYQKKYASNSSSGGKRVVAKYLRTRPARSNNDSLIELINSNENILCTIEAKQLQIDPNESGLKKLEAVKSYARRVTRAFSFNQDTPNKIRKTISSVFRSPFQSSSNSHYGHNQYQQTLGHQTSSKLASLASLNLTPTLSETKRKFMHTLKSSTSRASYISESTSTLNCGNHLLRQQTCSTMMSNQMTTSSLLSLDSCINEEKIMPPPPPIQPEMKPNGGAKVKKSSSENEHDRERRFPDITNINPFSSSGFKRQLT